MAWRKRLVQTEQPVEKYDFRGFGSRILRQLHTAAKPVATFLTGPEQSISWLASKERSRLRIVGSVLGFSSAPDLPLLLILGRLGSTWPQLGCLRHPGPPASCSIGLTVAPFIGHNVCFSWLG